MRSLPSASVGHLVVSSRLDWSHRASGSRMIESDDWDHHHRAVALWYGPGPWYRFSLRGCLKIWPLAAPCEAGHCVSSHAILVVFTASCFVSPGAEHDRWLQVQPVLKVCSTTLPAPGSCRYPERYAAVLEPASCRSGGPADTPVLAHSFSCRRSRPISRRRLVLKSRETAPKRGQLDVMGVDCGDESLPGDAYELPPPDLRPHWFNETYVACDAALAACSRHSCPRLVTSGSPRIVCRLVLTDWLSMMAALRLGLVFVPPLMSLRSRRARTCCRTLFTMAPSGRQRTEVMEHVRSGWQFVVGGSHPPGEKPVCT